jgi:WhiB family redox-sensing transcriptional regulator
MSGGEWVERAACLGSDPDLFFNGAASVVARARALCSTCPVSEECLEAALPLEVDYPPSTARELGIRGGMTGLERWELNRKRKLIAAAVAS